MIFSAHSSVILSSSLCHFSPPQNDLSTQNDYLHPKRFSPPQMILSTRASVHSLVGTALSGASVILSTLRASFCNRKALRSCVHLGAQRLPHSQFMPHAPMFVSGGTVPLVWTCVHAPRCPVPGTACHTPSACPTRSACSTPSVCSTPSACSTPSPCPTPSACPTSSACPALLCASRCSVPRLVLPLCPVPLRASESQCMPHAFV